MEEDSCFVKNISFVTTFNKRQVQCAGIHFLKYLAETDHTDGGHITHSDSSDKISEDDFEFEIDVEYLRSLDPKDWKDQDHYAVLGIKKLR